VNIIVCIKAVPSRVGNPKIVDGGARLRVESPQWLFNESDEYALEEALSLKKHLRARITAITIGPTHAQEILYASMARGADDAVRIDADEFDPNLVAYILSMAIKTRTYDLILTGVESADGMFSQVGVGLAAELGLPYAYGVTKIECATDLRSVIVERELGGGRYQTLDISLPALLSIQSGIARLSYTPAAKLFQARRTGAVCLTLGAVGVNNQDLDKRRTMKIVDLARREKNNSLKILSGDPDEVAQFIFDKVNEGH
jgi:electron transfer flavoprotein beta subunit